MKYVCSLAVLLAVGCAGVATAPGDSYSTMVKNEGRATWARTVDEEKWCEYFIGDRIYGSPIAVVAYPLSEWELWLSPIEIEGGKKIVIDTKSRSIEIDGKIYQRPPEPKVKWVRYNFSAMDSMLPHP